MVAGAYIASTAAYPYSNSILVRNLFIKTNRLFGLEFNRQIDRMIRSIQDVSTTQSADSMRAIYSETSSPLEESKKNIDLEDKKTNKQFMSARDIYMKVAQNLELIDLYSRVNSQII
jgi:hypothetical protein